jgi:hypothetical protein
MDKITIILGNEYDISLIEKLKKVLDAEGVVLSSNLAGIAGSQEFISYEFYVKGERIEIEIETYIGISLIGNEIIVNDLARKVKSY